MRSDVWGLLRRYDESLDKVEQYVSELLWYQWDFLQLLAMRVEAGLRSLKISAPRVPSHASPDDAREHLLETVFEPKMKWGERVWGAWGEIPGANLPGLNDLMTFSRECITASHCAGSCPIASK